MLSITSLLFFCSVNDLVYNVTVIPSLDQYKPPWRKWFLWSSWLPTMQLCDALHDAHGLFSTQQPYKPVLDVPRSNPRSMLWPESLSIGSFNSSSNLHRLPKPARRWVQCQTHFHGQHVQCIYWCLFSTNASEHTSRQHRPCSSRGTDSLLREAGSTIHPRVSRLSSCCCGQETLMSH